MSHIFIGIYDEDAVYGKRLMEYINRQKEYPLTAAAFASLEALTEFIASQDVKGVILEEGTQINSKVPSSPYHTGLRKRPVLPLTYLQSLSACRLKILSDEMPVPAFSHTGLSWHPHLKMPA